MDYKRNAFGKCVAKRAKELQKARRDAQERKPRGHDHGAADAG